MNVIVKARQTLADIAIQEYGDLRAVVVIAAENDLSVTDDIKPGIVLKCPEIIYNRYLQRYVSVNNISPATAIGSGDGIVFRIFTNEFNNVFA